MFTRCANCGKTFNISDENAGKQARCSACGARFTISPGIGAPPSASAPLAAEGATSSAAMPPSAAGLGTAPGQPKHGDGPGAAHGAPHSVRATAVPPPPAASSPQPIRTAATRPISPPSVAPSRASVRPQMPPAPPPFKAPVTIDATAMIGRVAGCLGRALCCRKLTFAVLAGVILSVLFYLLIRGLIPLVDSFEAAIFMGVVSFLVLVGLLGVGSGGIAHMAHSESQGKIATVGDAFAFCARRFPALFFGSILLVLCVVLGASLVNGIVHAVRSAGSIGSFFASFLYLPQMLVNLIIVLSVAVGVLVPCAIAVEGIGPIRALGRLGQLARARMGGLIVQLALTLVLGAITLGTLLALVAAARMPTQLSNGYKSRGLIRMITGGIGDMVSPFSSSSSSSDYAGFDLGTDRQSSFGSSFGSESSGGLRAGSRQDSIFGKQASTKDPKESGDGIRRFSWTLACVLVLAYPMVYWVTSFTSFYEGAHPARQATASGFPVMTKES